jgi:hypothetical protein
MSSGPADIARAILPCVVSLASAELTVSHVTRNQSIHRFVSRSEEKFSPATTRSWLPCHSAVAILFAHESQTKIKSATRVVTGSSRQPSHATGTEAAARRDLCRARAIFISLGLNLPLSPIRWRRRPIGRIEGKINLFAVQSKGYGVIGGYPERVLLGAGVKETGKLRGKRCRRRFYPHRAALSDFLRT